MSAGAGVASAGEQRGRAEAQAAPQRAQVNEWATEEHAADYLARGPVFPPHRDEGEAVLVAELPADVERVLDLGCGDGRLLDLVLRARPGATGVAVDMSPPMLDAVRARFEGDERVEVVEHDLEQPLPDGVGPFDVVVSGLAIHHCDDERKRALFGEIFDLLRPGGLFANLEHVASASPRLHRRFYEALDVDPADEDPSNKLAPVGQQLAWLLGAGFTDVDCLWKWRELALLAAVRPG